MHIHTYMQAYTWAPAHTNTGNKNQNDFYAWAGRSPWSLDDPQPSSESHQQQPQKCSQYLTGANWGQERLWRQCDQMGTSSNGEEATTAV